MNAQAHYNYDVFVSHSPADQGWVRAELLPRLEQAGLSVFVDYRDFELGVPKLVNIERAVKLSRKILIVLTPSWVASEWANFDALLVQTSDPAGQMRRMVPLLLELCAPPERIALLTHADFTQPTRRAAEMTRLLHALGTQSRIFISLGARSACRVAGSSAIRCSI